MRGAICIVLAAFLITLFHACTLDKHVFQSSCTIFEDGIAEKWWVTNDETTLHKEVYFHSYGELETHAFRDEVSYTLEDCNNLCVENLTHACSEVWEIEELTSVRLKITFPDRSSAVYRRI